MTVGTPFPEPAGAASVSAAGVCGTMGACRKEANSASKAPLPSLAMASSDVASSSDVWSDLIRALASPSVSTRFLSAFWFSACKRFLSTVPETKNPAAASVARAAAAASGSVHFERAGRRAVATACWSAPLDWRMRRPSVAARETRIALPAPRDSLMNLSNASRVISQYSQCSKATTEQTAPAGSKMLTSPTHSPAGIWARTVAGFSLRASHFPEIRKKSRPAFSPSLIRVSPPRAKW